MIKNIGIGVLLAIVIAGTYLPAKPARAQWVTTDIITELESGLSSAYNEIVSTFTDSEHIKEYILDPIAWAVAKAMVQQIVNSTVSWINSGFQGSPSFVQDPAGFFENMGDQLTGSFLSGPGSPLAVLCSPISLNVRLSLALNRANIGQNHYTCTLSKVISNVKGASINGFTAGDFNQGGWPAFVTLSDAQNNQYGAYSKASADLDVSIGNQTIINKDLLNQGSGFLSYRSCTDDPSLTNVSANDPNFSSYNYNSTSQNWQRCKITTPGATISAGLNKALGAGQDSLVTADEIDEIIGALAAQLVNQVLGPGGLSGVSQPSNGVPSYVTQIEGELNAPTPGTLGVTLSSDLSQYITNATQIQTYTNTSLGYAQSAQATMQNVMNYCQSATDTPVVAEIGAIMGSKIGPLVDQLSGEYSGATNELNGLASFNSQALAATSTADLNAMTQQYNSMLTSNSLPTLTDVSNAKTESSNVKSQTDTLNQQAAQYTQECQLYYQQWQLQQH